MQGGPFWVVRELSSLLSQSEAILLVSVVTGQRVQGRQLKKQLFGAVAQLPMYMLEQEQHEDAVSCHAAYDYVVTVSVLACNLLVARHMS